MNSTSSHSCLAFHICHLPQLMLKLKLPTRILHIDPSYCLAPVDDHLFLFATAKAVVLGEGYLEDVPLVERSGISIPICTLAKLLRELVLKDLIMALVWIQGQ